MRKMMTFVAVMLLAVTANAKILWEETFDRTGTYYIDKTEDGFWPYASQWFTGYTGSQGEVTGSSYSFDYTNVESYTVTIRGKKINGGDKNTIGLYFSANRTEDKDYVLFEGDIAAPTMGKRYLLFEICSVDGSDGGDLSTMVIKVNDNVVTVPATTLGKMYMTSTVVIELPNEAITSLYFAFNNVPIQKFLTHPRIVDTMWNLDLQSLPSNGGTVRYSAEKDLIQAIPNDGYIFLKWSDGNTSNPRTIEVMSDTSFIAEFVGGEGKCGETLVWAYNSVEHQISIVGAGEMDLNYEEFTWFDYKLSHSVQQLSLDEGMTNIDSEAFKGFHYLNTVTIPASVERIDESAFEDCRLLNSVVFAGKNLQSIGNWAFYNCHELQSIIIPEGVQEIGHAAFFNCVYLQELTLPATVKRIEDNSFAQCTKLKKMIVKATTPPVIDAKTFEGVDRSIALIVPKGSELLYSEADYWREFININPAPTDMDNVNTDVNTNKFLRNGQVIIRKNNKTYNTLGQEIK